MEHLPRTRLSVCLVRFGCLRIIEWLKRVVPLHFGWEIGNNVLQRQPRKWQRQLRYFRTRFPLLHLSLSLSVSISLSMHICSVFRSVLWILLSSEWRWSNYCKTKIVVWRHSFSSLFSCYYVCIILLIIFLYLFWLRLKFVHVNFWTFRWCFQCETKPFWFRG